MEIEKDKLLRFISLIHLTGAIEINECLAVGTKKSLKVCASSASKTFALKAELKGDYSDIGTIGIDDLGLLVKTVSLMDDIDITKKENILLLKNKTDKNKLLLRNTKYILTKLEEEKYDEASKNSRGNTFILTKEDIVKITNHCEIFKSNIGITGNKNIITVKIGNEGNSTEFKIKVKEEVEEFESLLSVLFTEALSNIKDKVSVNIKTNRPILIKTDNKDYSVEYFIAPLQKEK